MQYRALFLFICLSGAVSAQRDSLTNHDTEARMLRLYYQNDVFTGTDYYFTQGEQYEYIHPAFRRFLLRKILFHPDKNAMRLYGVVFRGGGYTPVRLDTSAAQINDRPFAAYMHFGYFAESRSEKYLFVFRNEISLGWIGPPALGKETQVFLHRISDSPPPLGWDQQVKTDLIAEYRIDFTKIIFEGGRIMRLLCGATVIAGTLRSRLSTEATIEAGLLPMFRTDRAQRFYLYLSGALCPRIVFYDALMQGGLLNRTSPHTFSGNEIERTPSLSKIGLVLGKKKIHAGFYVESVSPEFKGGLPHRWGSIELKLVL